LTQVPITMTIHNVALLGADGNLGPAVLHALVAGGFKVTVLKRQGSKSPDQYPHSVKVSRIPDDLPFDALTDALKGQDALVATIKGTQSDVQKKLADACIRSGVQRFIPADFGSCDSSTELSQQLVPLFKHKTELRQYLQQLAEKHKSFTWTSIVCGHFFDWSLEFIHINLQARKADVLDDGEYKCSMSTLARVGEATARVLQRPEQTENQMLYVQSFCVSQNEVVRAFEKATGEKFAVTRHDGEKFKNEERAKADEGNLEALEELVWYLGTVDADWTKRERFAMELLGLEEEHLDGATKEVVRQQQQQG